MAHRRRQPHAADAKSPRPGTPRKRWDCRSGPGTVSCTPATGTNPGAGKSSLTPRPQLVCVAEDRCHKALPHLPQGPLQRHSTVWHTETGRRILTGTAAPTSRFRLSPGKRAKTLREVSTVIPYGSLSVPPAEPDRDKLAKTGFHEDQWVEQMGVGLRQRGRPDQGSFHRSGRADQDSQIIRRLVADPYIPGSIDGDAIRFGEAALGIT